MNLVLVPVMTWVVVTILVVPQALSQRVPTRTTIDEIAANPVRVVDNVVAFEGFIVQNVQATSTPPSYYLIRSGKGAVFKVKNNKPAPKAKDLCYVTGIVNMDSLTREPFIRERSKWIVSHMAFERLRIRLY